MTFLRGPDAKEIFGGFALADFPLTDLGWFICWNPERLIAFSQKREIDSVEEKKKISPQKEKRRVVAGANSDEKPRQMATRPSGRSSRRRRRLMISISDRHLSLFLLLCDALIIAAHVPISSTAATVVILQRATWLSLVVCWAMLSGRAPVARYGSATHPILSSPSVNPN